MQSATYSRSFPASAGRVQARPTPLLSALFLVFAGLALLRVALGPLVLDLFVSYTTESGPIYGKLHPALYGFVLVALVALVNFRITLDAWEVRVLRALLAFNAGIVLILGATALMGRGGSTGFLIDTYCGSSFVVLLFLFPASWRSLVAKALILWLALSAVVAIAEFALKARLLPFDETESAFRPIGLASHPLELGLWMAIGPLFTAATDWSRRTKIALGLLFLVGLGVTGARTALVIGTVAAALVSLGAIGTQANAQRRLAYRLIAVAALIALIPLAILALAAFGGLDRFATGPGDANAQTRISIYGVFSHMTWAQLMLGMDPSALRAIAKGYFGLETVESSLVMMVALFGAVGTAFFVALFGFVTKTLLSGARVSVVLGTVVFFLIILSSNGLSGKGSGVFLLFTLIAALRPVPGKAASA